MDNSSNFEQQFTQNLKATAPQQPMMYEAKLEGTSGNSKLSLVVIIALAAITLLESIVLIITLSNYFTAVNDYFAIEDDYEGEEDIISDDDIYNAYVYDSNYNLTAMELTCTADDGSSYSFTKSNSYTGGGNSGAYTITNDSLVSLSGSGKVLYYDGFDLADGLTIYKCETNATETDAE